MPDVELGPDVIARVREAVDLVEVVADHVRLKRRGRGFEGLCPFHDEKTPSFSVDADKGLYYCFGCHQGGDAFRFVMELERLTFPEAVEQLARRFGVELPAAGPDARRRRREADRIRTLLEEAQHFFVSRLATAEGAAARRELERRGFGRDSWSGFGFGFAPGGWRALVDELGRRHPVGALVEAGLAAESDRGHEPYDRFRGRLMFPIRSADGRLVAFGGRVLGDGEPKYLNSPESEVFRKRSTLFALDRARRAVGERGEVVVVEGYFDCLSLHRVGVDWAVATLGTALTSEHARLLRRRLGEGGTAVLCYDADAAGRRAAVAGAKVLLGAGVDVAVLSLPDGADPDDVVREGGLEAFEAQLAGRRPLLELLIEGLPSHPSERRAAGMELLPVVAAAADPASRQSMLERLARETDMPMATLAEHAARAARTERRADGPASAPAVAAPVPAGERRLLHALLTGEPGLRRRVLDLVEVDEVTDRRVRAVIAAVREMAPEVLADGARLEASLLVRDDLAAVVAEVHAGRLPAPEADRLDAQLRQLERRRSRRALKRRTRALMEAERAGTGDDAIRLLEEQRDTLRGGGE